MRIGDRVNQGKHPKRHQRDGYRRRHDLTRPFQKKCRWDNEQCEIVVMEMGRNQNHRDKNSRPLTDRNRLILAGPNANEDKRRHSERGTPPYVISPRRSEKEVSQSAQVVHSLGLNMQVFLSCHRALGNCQVRRYSCQSDRGQRE